MGKNHNKKKPVRKHKVVLIMLFIPGILASCYTTGELSDYSRLADNEQIYLTDYQITAYGIDDKTALSWTEPEVILPSPNTLFISEPPGVLVKINGKTYRETPFAVSLPLGTYDLEYIHHEFLDGTGEVEVTGNDMQIVDLPLTPTSETVLRRLELERSLLYETKKNTADRGSFAKVMRNTGFFVGGLGIAASIVSYINISHLPSDSNQDVIDAAERNMTICLSAAGGGLLSGTIGQMLIPDTKNLDRQIGAITREITEYRSESAVGGENE